MTPNFSSTLLDPYELRYSTQPGSGYGFRQWEMLGRIRSAFL
jgi:hypothetical protein